MSKFMDTNGEPRWGVISATIGAIVFLLVFGFAFISEFFTVVPPSYKGLVIKGGQLQESVLNNGFYFKTPFWTDIEKVFVGTNSTDTDEGEEGLFRGIRPLSKDGQIMNIDVQINYTVTDPVKFRETVGSADPWAIEHLLFVPMVRRLVYDYTSEYTWKNLIQGGDRQELGQRLFQSLASGEITRRLCTAESKNIDVNTGAEIIVEEGCAIKDNEKVSSPADFGVTITSVNLRKVAPSDNIITAVEEAQKKEQEVKIAYQEAAIAKERANQLIEQKRGETDSRKLEVAAEAYKNQVELEATGAGLKAEAEGKLALAKAESALAAALRESSGLIEYKMVEVRLKEADAAIEFAKNYKGAVPNSVTIIGDEAARNNKLLLGLPGVNVLTQE